MSPLGCALRGEEVGADGTAGADELGTESMGTDGAGAADEGKLEMTAPGLGPMSLSVVSVASASCCICSRHSV